MDTKRQVNAILEKKTSSKGTEYWSVTIELTPDYEMVAFPNKAETALLNSYLISSSIEKPLNID